MALASILLGILERPTMWDVMIDLTILAIPLWLAVIVGVVLGWSWRPKWANFVTDFPVPSLSPIGFDSIPGFGSLKAQLPCLAPSISNNELDDQISNPNSSSAVSSSVNEADLRHLRQLVVEKNGGPAWIHMMDRSTPTMAYKAWRRDPQTGPPQYRSSTVFEDSTPEMVKDFFWDDEFRFKWDDMLIHHATLEECTATGIMIVHWVRKFPFFCSDREYVIGRRIWESDGSYYCVTKGVHYPSLPRHSKPRRVDLYYSSWCIRPAASRKDGEMSACEVLLFHHEDMGIPWEIAKYGVRQGMWGAVKKIDPGLRAYQKERACGALLSRSATMAHKNTKVSPDKLRFLEDSKVDDLAVGPVDGESSSSSSSGEKQAGNVPKLLVVGGAVALACTLDKGLLTKALIFGVARRFVRTGRKL
ncbi:hypothetical protein V2J09_022182 [Rumex salicifolius]